MANSVTITWTEKDFTSASLSGRITFALSNPLLDVTNGVTYNNVPVHSYRFVSSAGTSDPLIANDNAFSPPGSYYTITVEIDGQAPYSWTAFINFANGASQTLTKIQQTPAVPQTLGLFLPLPTGTPGAGQVPVATGSGESSAWGSVATNPMTGLGDLTYGGTGGAPTRLPGDISNARRFLRELSSGGVATVPVWDALLAGDIPALVQYLLLAGGTMTGWLAPAVATLTFVASGTTLVNAALGNSFNLTLTASTTTIGNPSNPVDGQVIRFRITQGGAGSFTTAWGTAYDFGASGAPVLSTAAGKVDVVGFEYVASISKWCYLGSALGN